MIVWIFPTASLKQLRQNSFAKDVRFIPFGYNTFYKTLHGNSPVGITKDIDFLFYGRNYRPCQKDGNPCSDHDYLGHIGIFGVR
jgi:hypothetical protein